MTAAHRNLTSIHWRDEPTPEVLALLGKAKKQRDLPLEFRYVDGGMVKAHGWLALVELAPGEVTAIFNLGERPRPEPKVQLQLQDGFKSEHRWQDEEAQNLRIESMRDKHQTDERNKEIIRLREAKMPYTQIARRLGLTRHAVEGVMRRYRKRMRGQQGDAS